MMRPVKARVAMLAGLVLLAACGVRMAQLEEPTGVPIQGDFTMDEIEQAIEDAASERGWEVTKEAEGHLLGVLHIRDHRADVDIVYDESSFSIEYRDSSNLGYDAERDTIHRNYNNWVRNLENDIHARLVE